MVIKHAQGLYMVLWYHCWDRRNPSDDTKSGDYLHQIHLFYLVGSKNENTTVFLQIPKFPWGNK